MTALHRQTALRLTVAGVVVGLALAGCGKDDDSSSKSSSASSSAATSATSSATSSAAASATSGAAAPAAGDLSVLLMKPEGIPPTPAGPWVGEAPKADPAPPASVSQFYKSGDNNIQSTVFLLPDADAAAKLVTDTLASPNLASLIKGTQAPAPNVNKGAQVINGTSADGSASMSILMFSEGKVAAQVNFIGKVGDPVSADYLDTVGVIQLDAIQQNLSKVGG
ncbi:hypothetical protein [Mycolicibacterium sphagni]|uniref:Lipoprotein LpqN n=1 Tax=Mycolicibacterium sphagni TaxID=1786 RepID=A0ABX2JX66_9MYCO|nr:hypothetical protein [Mycolicibacterium sphagni]NTY61188.1 hypothetical protein [Mycolicibacterium sphagni]